MADPHVKRFSLRATVDKLEKPERVVPAYKFSKGVVKVQTDLVNRK
jgi:hypothetical protein